MYQLGVRATNKPKVLFELWPPMLQRHRLDGQGLGQKLHTPDSCFIFLYCRIDLTQPRGGGLPCWRCLSNLQHGLFRPSVSKNIGLASIRNGPCKFRSNLKNHKDWTFSLGLQLKFWSKQKNTHPLHWGKMLHFSIWKLIMPTND